MIDLINKIDNGEEIIVDGRKFNKKILNELIIDYEASKTLYNSKNCQNLIEMYYIYTKKEDKDFSFRKVFIAFFIGLGGGVFIAGIIAMIEQLLIRK